MKYILILLISLTAFAQTDSISQSNISVISAERLNVVYRGMNNPIKIAVPGAVSFTASAPGLRKGTSEGNYILNPGQGKEVTIIIVAKMPNGKYISEKKAFRIMGLPAPMGLINGENCEICTINLSKKELENAIISVGVKDFPFVDQNSDFFVAKSFIIKINDITISIEGNKMSTEALKVIDKLKSGSILIIDDIKYGPFSVEAIPKRAYPIVVEISGD